MKDLNSRFRKIEKKKTYGAKFTNRNQKNSGTVEEFAADLRKLYDKAYLTRDRKVRQEDLLRHFLDGLSDVHLIQLLFSHFL